MSADCRGRLTVLNREMQTLTSASLGCGNIGVHPGTQGGGAVGRYDELQSEACVHHLPLASILMTFQTPSKDFYHVAGLLLDSWRSGLGGI